MAAIKGHGTKPEVMLRSALHRAGYRFRLNSRLPGKPDLVMKKHWTAVFVHGCFWHKHDCPRFKQPGGKNVNFWCKKLARNAERDGEVTHQLRALGWRQYVVWECTLIGKGRLDLHTVVDRMRVWLTTDEETGEISGHFD